MRDEHLDRFLTVNEVNRYAHHPLWLSRSATFHLIQEKKFKILVSEGCLNRLITLLIVDLRCSSSGSGNFFLEVLHLSLWFFLPIFLINFRPSSSHPRNPLIVSSRIWQKRKFASFVFFDHWSNPRSMACQITRSCKWKSCKDHITNKLHPSIPFLKQWLKPFDYRAIVVVSLRV